MGHAWQAMELCTATGLACARAMRPAHIEHRCSTCAGAWGSWSLEKGPCRSNYFMAGRGMAQRAQQARQPHAPALSASALARWPPPVSLIRMSTRVLPSRGRLGAPAAGRSGHSGHACASPLPPNCGEGGGGRSTSAGRRSKQRAAACCCLRQTHAAGAAATACFHKSVGQLYCRQHHQWQSCTQGRHGSETRQHPATPAGASPTPPPTHECCRTAASADAKPHRPAGEVEACSTIAATATAALPRAACLAAPLAAAAAAAAGAASGRLPPRGRFATAALQAAPRQLQALPGAEAGQRGGGQLQRRQRAPLLHADCPLLQEVVEGNQERNARAELRSRLRGDR